MKREEKKQLNKERQKLLADAILRRCREMNQPIVGVTSSFLKCKKVEAMLEQLSDYLNSEGHDVAVIQYDEKTIEDISALPGKLKGMGEKELTFVSIPPFSKYANALLCAEQIGAVLLIEQYTDTKYKDLEDLLSAGNNNGITVLGVAAIK